MAGKLCRACGILLHDVLLDQGDEYHPNCDPQLVMDERNRELRGQIIDMIHYVDRNAPRSLQVEIGPSEIGNPCDQYIGRVLAGSPQINFRADPWAKLVGTAIHTWMEQSIRTYRASIPGRRAIRDWVPEIALPIDDMITGHSDLYTGEDVVDWKTKSKELLAAVRKNGPSEQERIQLQTYAFGHFKAGRKVRDVVFVFMPRSGRIKEFYLWREPFDATVARDALARVYRIGKGLLASGALEDGKLWGQVPMAPGGACWTCPFNSSKLSSDDGPDESGCPGTNGTAEQMREADAKRGFNGIL